MTRPNILFVFPDQWRGDWIKALSPELPLRTPILDSLIAGGTAFTRAWTPSPLCVPARSCLATGRAYGKAPASDNTQSNPVDVDTFYRRLSDAGYEVASFGKTDLFKPDKSWGKDGRHIDADGDKLARFGITSGRDMAGKHDSSQAAALDCNDPYTDRLERAGLLQIYLDDLSCRSGDSAALVRDWETGRVVEPEPCYANTAPSPLPPEHYADNVVGLDALDYLRTVDESDPWLLMVNFPGPHEPMDVTEEMAANWSGTTFPLPYGRQTADPTRQNEIRCRYAAMLENIDTWLGRMIEALRQRDMMQNTVILFASDHGEMLGDRNSWKKQVPYEPSVRVPLIWYGSGLEAHGAVDSPASLLDIPATLLSLAQAAALEQTDGYDLSAYLAGRGLYPRMIAQSGLGTWRAVTDGRWKLVTGFRTDQTLTQLQFGGSEPGQETPGLLYDLQSDPLEASNLWDDCSTERERLRSHL